MNCARMSFSFLNFLTLTLWSGPTAVAVNSALDRVQVFQPGLSLSLICRAPCPNITLDPNGPTVAFPDPGASGTHDRIDVLGSFYSTDGPSDPERPVRSFGASL